MPSVPVSNRNKGHIDTLIYVYDFGDWWYHVIQIKSRDYFMPEFDGDAVCIGGKGNFVLEDCGGADGFMDICDMIVNEKRGCRGILKNIYDRYGVKDYNPTKFDIKSVNESLKNVSHNSCFYIKNLC